MGIFVTLVLARRRGPLAKAGATFALCTMLVVAAGCSSEPAPSAVSSETSATATGGVASATRTSTSSDLKLGPQTVAVPDSLEDGDIVAGTLVTKDACTGGQDQVQVFDPTAGKLVTVSAPPEPADETRTSLMCTVFTRNGDYYVSFAVSSQTKASGLNGSQSRHRLYTYPLGSTTPTVIDLKGELRSLVSTDAGPAVVLSNGPEFTLAVYSGEGPTPTWTAPTSADGITGVGSAIMTELAPQLTLLDAATGKPLYSRCASDQAGFLAEVSDGFVTVRDDCGPDRQGTLVGYDTATKKEVFAIAPASGLYVPDDLSASADYLLILGNKRLVVIDRESGETVVTKSGDDFEKLNIQNAFVFADRLYLSTKTGGKSVVSLPSGTTESESWTVRPTAMLDGWTLVIRDNGDRELIRDQNGAYPGPWS